MLAAHRTRIRAILPQPWFQTFGGYSAIFCAATWASAAFGELYPPFGNSAAPFTIGLAVLCHFFAIVAYKVNSGRKLATMASASFWLIAGCWFVYTFVDIFHRWSQLD